MLGTQAQNQPAVEENPVELRIEAGSSGACFFVLGVNGNEDVKKKLKDLGGCFNSRMRGYKFATKQIETVCKAFDLEETNIKLRDPRQMITIQLQSEVHWDNDMSVAEQKLKEIGLKKKSGKGNVWQGDLNKAEKFFAMFHTSSK